MGLVSDATPARLSMRLLGPVEVLVDGRPLAVDTRKAVALLAFLALTARPASRESLASLLWPEADEHAARGALRRTLSVLNAGLTGAGLSIDRDSVALDLATVHLDVTRFRSAVARARRHGHSPDRACIRCHAALAEALSLDRGLLMESFVIRDSEPWDEWLEMERQSHQRELAGALERMVRERLAAESWSDAIVAGRRWLELDVLHEPAHRALMHAYARSGEAAAAVHQYRDAAAILEHELGVAPLPETTDLYEAISSGTFGPSPGPVTGQVRPEDGLPSAAVTPPLIGRDAELEQILAVLDLASPDGRLIAIEGEAGIGKTRLADAVVERATAAGSRSAAARCYPGEAGIALAPIVTLLRGVLALPGGRDALAALPVDLRARLAVLVPELDAGRVSAPIRDSGPTARLRVLEAIADGLTVGGLATARPGRAGIVRVDDLQWADDSTLEALGFLAHRLRSRPILLLLSWRREELDERAQPLVAVAEASPGAHVRLDRLSPQEVGRLIDALVAAGRAAPASTERDGLVDEAEGLPLYVVEALAAPDRAAGSVPAGIRALLQARLANLTEIATQLVAAAAVLGRSFDAESVRLVSGRSEDETVLGIEELTRRGIVHESETGGVVRYDFAHARLRDVAYESTSLARRRLLHRRAAQALRGQAGRELDRLGRLARTATHEQAAGREAEAADAFLEAGDLARTVFANQEALEYFEAALALGHGDVVRIHSSIGDVRTRIGDYPRAIAAFETAAAAAPPDHLAGIEYRLGWIHLRRADPRRADQHFVAALAALDEANEESGPRRSQILADRAVATARGGQPDLAADLATQARDMAGDDRAAQAEAERILGLLARERGDLVAAAGLLDSSMRSAAGLGDPVPAIAAANALALVCAERGELDRGLELANGAAASARRAGERHLEAAVENNLADMLRAAGREEDAMVHLRAAVTAFADVAVAPGELEPGIWMLETW